MDRKVDEKTGPGGRRGLHGDSDDLPSRGICQELWSCEVPGPPPRDLCLVETSRRGHLGGGGEQDEFRVHQPVKTVHENHWGSPACQYGTSEPLGFTSLSTRCIRTTQGSPACQHGDQRSVRVEQHVHMVNNRLLENHTQSGMGTKNYQITVICQHEQRTSETQLSVNMLYRELPRTTAARPHDVQQPPEFSNPCT